jgi:hypothetical protein
MWFGAKEDDSKSSLCLFYYSIYELEAQIVEGCTTVLVKDLPNLSA